MLAEIHAFVAAHAESFSYGLGLVGLAGGLGAHLKIVADGRRHEALLTKLPSSGLGGR